MPRKIVKFRKTTPRFDSHRDSRYVIQVFKAKLEAWRVTRPVLLYDSKESALAGVARLLTHKPDLLLRAWPYMGSIAPDSPAKAAKAA